MHNKLMKHHVFYGTTSLGEKGQVVIPVKARKDMAVGRGEQLLVFGVGGEMVVLSRLSNMQKFASHMERQLKDLKKIIKERSK